MGSWGGEDLWQGICWRTGQSHICVWINWEEQLGSETESATQGSSMRKKGTKPLNVKPVEVVAAGDTPSLTREFVGDTHRVLEHTQNHPLGNQHQKGPICLWVVEEVT